MGDRGPFARPVSATGRTSGKAVSTPISFTRDGPTLLAYNRDGSSNWVKNLPAHPEVTLEVQRQVGRYRASIVRDLLEHDRVFAGYLASKTFRRVLGIATLPHADELARAREQVQFVRFEPLS